MARFYSRLRDDQRSAVYKAERAAFQGRLQQQDVSTPERMRRRLDQILLSPWFLATYPKTAARQIGLEFGRLGGANANESRIRLGRNAFAMQEWILIHELSHVVVRREIPSKYRVGGVDYTEYAQARRNLNWSTGERIIVDAPQGHGHEYCDVYLKLAEQFLAAGAADELRRQFDAHRVGYQPRAAIVLPSARPKRPFIARAVLVAGGTILASVCAELGVSPKIARRQLRKAGLHAPYTDEAKIREVLGPVYLV